MISGVEKVTRVVYETLSFGGSAQEVAFDGQAEGGGASPLKSGS